MKNSQIGETQVMEVLKKVKDPDIGRNIVDLGFIKNLKIEGGKVSFDIELTTPACPVKNQMEKAAKDYVASIPGVEEVSVTMTSNTRFREVKNQNFLPGVKNSIAVASGKGGVGKSTVAVNLAVALAKSGAKTGLLDTDIYGPSIPMMFGINERPKVSAEKKLMPLERYGLKLMSMGFLVDEHTPIIWRGPLVHSAIQQFMTHVDWGNLDYLVMDLPPGTGDAQLTIVQSAPLAGAVIVTTPQDVALLDAKRGLEMFKKVNVPVLGIIENMSYFLCPHCNTRSEIFGYGGGKKTAEKLEVPFLGEVPLIQQVREGGDSGDPIVHLNPASPASLIFMEIAGKIAANLSIINMETPVFPGEQITWVTNP